jgi:ADP-heptose:LPS heptosyltransferase
VHAGALGDVLLAVPALRALRASVSDHRLMLAAEPRLAALLAALAVADEPLSIDALGLDALFSDEPGRDARLPCVERLVCWLGARDPVFVRRLRAAVPDAVIAPSVGEGDLVWRHLLATVGATSGDWRTAVHPGRALLDAGEALLRDAGWDGARPVLIVQPGAGTPAKRWPVAAFAAALSALPEDVVVVIHQGPADAEPAAALAARRPRCLLLREPSLPALAGALARATTYVGNDCGVSHLAAAVGTPSVVLFAAANTRWRPWADGVRVLTVATDGPRAEDVGAAQRELARLIG